MSAEETLKLISKQRCSITDLMKLLGCGRNKALEVKKDIKDKLIKEIKNNWNKRFNKFYDTAIIFSKIKN